LPFCCCLPRPHGLTGTMVIMGAAGGGITITGAPGRSLLLRRSTMRRRLPTTRLRLPVRWRRPLIVRCLRPTITFRRSTRRMADRLVYQIGLLPCFNPPRLHAERILRHRHMIGVLAGAALGAEEAQAGSAGSVTWPGCAATLARALRWCRLPRESECVFRYLVITPTEVIPPQYRRDAGTCDKPSVKRRGVRQRCRHLAKSNDQKEKRRCSSQKRE
jgi:hypothetical protein